MCFYQLEADDPSTSGNDSEDEDGSTSSGNDVSSASLASSINEYVVKHGI